jgi:hypothetical protein
MAKHLPGMNRFVLLLIASLLCSCTEDWAFRQETLTIADENRDWVCDDSLWSGFLMVDNNGISQGFNMKGNSTGFSPSRTLYFGIPTHSTQTESFTQSWSSNYGVSLMSILTAGFDPYGDHISISINGLDFMYDFKFKTLFNIWFQSSSLSRTMTDVGFDDNVTINSTVEILDRHTVNGTVYDSVLHFAFADFREMWRDNTVTNLYFAKKEGLIEYALHSGVVFRRIASSLLPAKPIAK